MKLNFRRVIITDDCRATLDGPDGFCRGWLHTATEIPRRLRRQQGGGGVMFWAGIMYNKVSLKGLKWFPIPTNFSYGKILNHGTTAYHRMRKNRWFSCMTMHLRMLPKLQCQIWRVLAFFSHD